MIGKSDFIPIGWLPIHPHTGQDKSTISDFGIILIAHGKPWVENLQFVYWKNCGILILAYVADPCNINLASAAQYLNSVEK